MIKLFPLIIITSYSLQKNERIVHSNRHNFGVGKDLSTFKEKDENGYYKLVPVDGPGGEKKEIHITNF